MTEDKKHKRYLRKRRMRALRAVLCYANSRGFRDDYNIFVWFSTLIKVVICLLMNRVGSLPYGGGAECFAQYDEYFDVDHYEWMSVWVYPSWFKAWKVEITQDGE